MCLSFAVETATDYPDSVQTNQISEAGNMLKQLDPILITIIAMSALGVFLGAICGVVLYCACSHGAMSERNLSALENYNFELVDGVKLKKDKLNVQNSYSEAWVYDGQSSHKTEWAYPLVSLRDARLNGTANALNWQDEGPVQVSVGGLDWSTLFSGAAVKQPTNRGHCVQKTYRKKKYVKMIF